MTRIHNSPASQTIPQNLMSNEISWDKAAVGAVEFLLGLAGLGYWIGAEVGRKVGPMIAPTFDAALARVKDKTKFIQSLRVAMGSRMFQGAMSRARNESEAAKLINAAIEAAAKPPRKNTGHAPAGNFAWPHTGNNRAAPKLPAHSAGHGPGINLEMSNTGGAAIDPANAFGTLLPRTRKENLTISVLRSENGASMYTAAGAPWTIGVLTMRDDEIRGNIETLKKKYPGSVSSAFGRLPAGKPLILLAHGSGSTDITGSARPMDREQTLYSAGHMTLGLMNAGASNLPYVLGLICFGADPNIGNKVAQTSTGMTYASVNVPIRVNSSGKVEVVGGPSARKLAKIIVYFPDGTAVDAGVKFPANGATLEELDKSIRNAIKNKPQGR